MASPRPVRLLLVALSVLAAGCLGGRDTPPAPGGPDDETPYPAGDSTPPPPTVVPEPPPTLTPTDQVQLRVLGVVAGPGNGTRCGAAAAWCHVVDVELRNLAGRTIAADPQDWRGRFAPRTGDVPVDVVGGNVSDGATGAFSLAFAVANETLRISTVRFVPTWLAGPVAATVPAYNVTTAPVPEDDGAPEEDGGGVDDGDSGDAGADGDGGGGGGGGGGSDDGDDVVAPGPLAEASGNGAGTSSSFEIASSLVRTSTTAEGTGPFEVWLVDAQGARVVLLARGVAPYHGERHIGIDPSESHRIEFVGAGAWSVDVYDVAATAPDAPPSERAGDGDGAPAPVVLEAIAYEVTLSHNGTGVFVVRVLDADGDVVGTLADEEGGWIGTATFTPSAAATYWLDVRADGPWYVEVR
ncbi:MAG TPA: hypothetical protein VI997_02750 [Candidatus Thermoplasmatota archaeon]|nr:hypothetical protein [Candidatus Thermoplasmatota archaeon]